MSLAETLAVIACNAAGQTIAAAESGDRILLLRLEDGGRVLIVVERAQWLPATAEVAANGARR